MRALCPFLKALLSISIFAFLLSSSFGQSGTLLIKTLSDEDGAFLDKAQVLVSGPGISLRALSENGLASFSDLPSGRYKIEVSAPGYAGKSADPELDYSKKPSYSGSFRLAKAKLAQPQETAAAKAPKPPRKPLGIVVKDGLSPLDSEYAAANPASLSQIEPEAVYEDSVSDLAAERASQASIAAPPRDGAVAAAAPPPSASAGFLGLSKGLAGALSLILLFALISDIGAFCLLLLLKWRSMGPGAKARLAFFFAGSNAVLGIAFICALAAFISAPNDLAAPKGGASSASQGKGSASSEEALALESFLRVPDEAGAQRLASLRERMARDFAVKALSSNDAELYRKALLYADSAAELSSADPVKLLLAGSLYARIGNSPDAKAAALERFEKAYALAPESVEIRMALGDVCAKLERNKQALSLFESVVSESPKAASPELVRGMALCYMKERLYAQCASFFGALLKADPGNDAARIALSAALRARGDSQGADAELRGVASRKGADPEMQAYAAKLLAAWSSSGKGGAE